MYPVSLYLSLFEPFAVCHRGKDLFTSWENFADMVIKYLLDSQIILVVVQMHGPMLGVVVKFSVNQDHTAQAP